MAADVGPDVVQGTRSASRLLGSVVRAANTTAPLISDVGQKKYYIKRRLCQTFENSFGFCLQPVTIEF